MTEKIQKNNKLKWIFKKYWKGIMFSYLLVILSNSLFFIYPKVLGNTIDHLINKEYIYLLSIIFLFIGFIVMSFISNIYDTRVFSRLLKDISQDEIKNQLDSGVDSGVINGRYGMLSSIISFFENDIPQFISSMISIIGSLILIFMIDIYMGFGLILSGIVSLGISKMIVPKLTEIRKRSNDLNESQTNILTGRNIIRFNRLTTLKQLLSLRNSYISAIFFVLIQLVAYGTVSILILYYIINLDITVGSTFSTYRYLFEFCGSITVLPNIISNVINLKDILNRFEEEN